jgi:hypothetical protein
MTESHLKSRHKTFRDLTSQRTINHVSELGACTAQRTCVSRDMPRHSCVEQDGDKRDVLCVTSAKQIIVNAWRNQRSLIQATAATTGIDIHMKDIKTDVSWCLLSSSGGTCHYAEIFFYCERDHVEDQDMVGRTV